MAELKTRATQASVEQFLNDIADEKTRRGCVTVLEIMKDITKAEPKLWGTSIVGFGSYHYKYESGREGEWMLTGFSPRKDSLTVYITSGFDQFGELLKKLGKHKTGKSCLYIKDVDAIDLPTLKRLIRDSVKRMKQLNKSPD